MTDHMNPPGTEGDARERVAQWLAGRDDVTWVRIGERIRGHYRDEADELRPVIEDAEREGARRERDALIEALDRVRPSDLVRDGDGGADDVERAIRAADSGDAGHWPTVAAVLRDEVDRLRSELADMTTQRDAERSDKVRAWKRLGESGGEINVQRLRAVAAEAELERWTSGKRRKHMPRVESVPDALNAAATMARASHDDDLPDHIVDMMRGNAHRMKQLHDAASALIAERDEARWECDGKQAFVDSLEQKLTQACAERDTWRRWCGEAEGWTPPADESSETCQCQNCQPVPPGLNPMGED